MSVNIARYGGKAAGLKKLEEFGALVPEWFCIESSTFLNDGVIPAEKLISVEEKLSKIGQGKFAVRSSAVDEDGDINSFAGQFLSVLNVHRDDVLTAAKNVFLSGLSDSVEQYRLHKNSESYGGVSVIIQKMVQAKASGVIFTSSIETGSPLRAVISAVSGFGDKLMSGEESGWTWEANLASRSIRILSEDGSEAPLTDNEIWNIVDTGREIAQKAGKPQDIEWAIEEGKVYILQMRPITTLVAHKHRIFDNSNIVESYPGIVSPMTFSFASYVYAEVYRALLSTLGVSAKEIEKRDRALKGLLARFDGHVYYDLGSWHRLLSALPGYSLNSKAMDQMMGVGEPLPDGFIEHEGGSKTSSLLQIVRAGVGLAWSSFRFPKIKADFEKRLDEALSTSVSQSSSLDELADVWFSLESKLLKRWDAPLVNDLLCMIAVAIARHATKKWAVGNGDVVFNEFMIGQQGIVSAEPPKRIREMANILRPYGQSVISDLEGYNFESIFKTCPEFKVLFENYMEKFGDRCVEELKLESKSLRDDPTNFVSALTVEISQGSELIRSNAEYNKPVFKSAVGGVIAKKMLTIAGDRVRDRENLRFERTRVFGVVRKVVRTIGLRLYQSGLIEDKEDVFYLTKDEVLGFIEGWSVSSDLKSIIKVRKEEELSLSNKKIPPDRIETFGPAHSYKWTEKKNTEYSETEITGLGCSSGFVSGVANVIRDPKNARLNKGEILVARSTDPGWIALFSNASAIVVEKGSILSHSAIVAREMGIPCVVGVKGVLDWIESGEIIEVDGSTGTVRKKNEQH